MRPGGLFRLAAALYLVLALGGLAWIGVQRGGIPASLFLPRAADWWVDPLAGAAGAGALLLAWWAARRWGIARQLEITLRERLGPLTVAEAYGLALISGVAEEVLFRGAVQPAWGFYPATLIFAALHSGRGRAMLLWTTSALAAGAVLGALMLWRGTLFAPIVCHVLVNAVQLRRLLATPPEATPVAPRPPA